MQMGYSDADTVGRPVMATIDTWTAPKPRYARSQGRPFGRDVIQADQGCDFDFLETEFGAAVAEPDIF